MPRLLVAVGLVLVLFAGFSMGSLESEAGNTVAEAFYNHMGWGTAGVGVMILAIFLLLAEKKSPVQDFGGAPGECPDCHQFISRSAVICPHCQSRLAAPPATSS